MHGVVGFLQILLALTFQVDKYGKGAIYMVTTFFNSLEDFWCTDAVQNAIANGTFAEEYGKTDDV